MDPDSIGGKGRRVIGPAYRFFEGRVGRLYKGPYSPSAESGTTRASEQRTSSRGSVRKTV